MARFPDGEVWMFRSICLLGVLWLMLAAPVAGQAGTRAVDATRLLDRTIARMGGDSLLRSVQSVRLDMLTQWLRINFADQPFGDAPSYERNVELRDYGTRSWRNTRQFLGSGPAISIVDVVVDTVAARWAPTSATGDPAWTPLNVAYVYERRELFGFAPERLILHLRDDPGVRQLADTAINGERHARLRSVVDGWPAEVFLNHRDGLPTMVRFHADERNDFGLAPWGVHEVEFWYSGWAPVAPGMLLPRQRDVRRVGKPYKRMTAISIRINAPAPRDSFAITAEVASGYLATQQQPMWQVSIDSAARLLHDHFVAVPPSLGSAGAVAVGGQWVLVETAQHEGAAALLERRLTRERPGTPVGTGLATLPSPGNGGVRWFAQHRLPIYVSPGAAPVVRTNLAGAGSATVISRPRWVRIGTDSLWMEPVAAHGFPGLMAIYSPTLRWLYFALAGIPAYREEQTALIASFRSRGMPVDFIGGSRAIATPVAPAP